MISSQGAKAMIRQAAGKVALVLVALAAVTAAARAPGHRCRLRPADRATPPGRFSTNAGFMEPGAP